MAKKLTKKEFINKLDSILKNKHDIEMGDDGEFIEMFERGLTINQAVKECVKIIEEDEAMD